MIFRIAPMCRTMRVLTACLLLLPVSLLLGAFLAQPVLLAPAVVVVSIYAWVWLRFRPTRFVVHPGFLEIVWPLKRRALLRRTIHRAKIVTAKELKNEVGWGTRVGAGGLWGGFGWLWTKRRGIVQMYISRMDRFVWIERGSERPWLITPENPEAFVQAMTSSRRASA